MDEGCCGRGSDRQRGGNRGGRGRGGAGCSWGVHVAQEARRGGVRVLLEGRRGVLGVCSAEVKVRACRGGGDLSRKNQTGLEEGLRVNIRLAEPRETEKERGLHFNYVLYLSNRLKYQVD